MTYYLTADELLGDLIRISLKADRTLLNVDPLREVLPPQDAAPMRLRIGPGWYALASRRIHVLAAPNIRPVGSRELPRRRGTERWRW